ncbi:ATP/GTP-binding protein [filamentous cyanobacterium LEGE 11480]|uniref:ATP/GTP-binding protein n=1 Tax=Romeriopsis navalis LEGE 11480 TaxID=2777977 RepID=A0A928VL50_9CYAN|nr:ATP/GTP-binding protein [Romeriopsis navalis]MBE9030315.1 ATP/GTP-binding protein [Romeriopsis navalis LEGE 11480]
MALLKVVVAGPAGSGKSTLIRTISEIDVVDTDRHATDETSTLKENTTVAFDFGKLNLPNNVKLHLYGTPGQERFDFMWDMLIENAHGYIVLVAAHRPHEFRYARSVIKFMQNRQSIPMMVGITHTDQPDAWSKENILFALRFGDETAQIPFSVVNPTDHESATQAVTTLVNHIHESALTQAT